MNEDNNSIVNLIVEKLDISDTAYENAEKRYKDLFRWFNREESTCKKFQPNFYPAGSFSLGTVTQPLDESDDYDLDIHCKLSEGLSKKNQSQKKIKDLVGSEIEAYRLFRQIKKEKKEKRHCWSIEYLDELTFHMDIVPCLPLEEAHVQNLNEEIIKNGMSHEVSKEMAEQAVQITDNEDKNYSSVTKDWRPNNSQGYAKWFRTRSKQATALLENKAKLFNVASIDELPLYKWKTPLQKCIQVLKRHRDIMFRENKDVKPSSIIIATLAAKVYSGESELETAIAHILEKMTDAVSPNYPRVPNPAFPAEDFADRWSREEYRHLELEHNFWLWLEQAKRDFDFILESKDADLIKNKVGESFSVNLASDQLPSVKTTEKVIERPLPKYSINKQDVAKPWFS